MPVPSPVFQIKYNGKDVSESITADCIDCDYLDHTEGKSDEISITLDDTSGNWRGPWYPEKGATLELEIIDGEKKLKCGTFEIDNISQSGPPHTVAIKGLAAGIGKAIRTKNSRNYDKTTLKGIAQKIAAVHGMTVQGEIENIPIEYAAQHRKKDLEYLRELAISYGYVFSIRDKKLIFTTQEKLEKDKEILTIDLTEMTSYSFDDKAVEVFKDSKVAYHNPKEGKVITAKTDSKEIANRDGIGFNYATAADSSENRVRVENTQQAKAKSRARLYRMNTKQNEGSIELPGNTLLVAGINIMVTGLGVLSGKYHVLESLHKISRSSGYTTSIKVKRVGAVQDKKQQQAKPAKKAAKAPPTAAPATPGVQNTPNRDGINFRTLG